MELNEIYLDILNTWLLAAGIAQIVYDFKVIVARKYVLESSL
jgi:hypothetical protein